MQKEQTAPPWFGMELCYDYGFGSQQLNGNIAGEMWRSRGDGERRAYGFAYDPVNRLTGADFSQLTTTGSTSSWQNNKIDFSVSNLTYDDNGNIQSMNQKQIINDFHAGKLNGGRQRY